VGISLRIGLSSGWPRATKGPKFKLLLPRSCVPRPAEYTGQVSSTSAQRSRSLIVLKMLTPARTDGRTDGHVIGFTNHLGRDDQGRSQYEARRGNCLDRLVFGDKFLHIYSTIRLTSILINIQVATENTINFDVSRYYMSITQVKCYMQTVLNNSVASHPRMNRKSFLGGGPDSQTQPPVRHR